MRFIWAININYCHRAVERKRFPYPIRIIGKDKATRLSQTMAKFSYPVLIIIFRTRAMNLGRFWITKVIPATDVDTNCIAPIYLL